MTIEFTFFPSDERTPVLHKKRLLALGDFPGQIVGVAAELHEERDVGGRGQPARRERHHRQPTRRARLTHNLQRNLKMIHGQFSFI